MRLILSTFLIMGTTSPALAQAQITFDQSCDNQQQAEVTAAFNVAIAHINTVHGEVSGTPANWQPVVKNTYLNWFGTPGQYTTPRFQAVIDSVTSQLNANTTTYGVTCMVPYDPQTDEGCEAGDFAYTTPNQRFTQELTFCDGFFGARADGGYNSQWGAVIHEVTHSAANTEDHAYSTVNARALRSSDAVDNADNYEYFMETLFLN